MMLQFKAGGSHLETKLAGEPPNEPVIACHEPECGPCSQVINTEPCPTCGPSIVCGWPQCGAGFEAQVQPGDCCATCVPVPVHYAPEPVLSQTKSEGEPPNEPVIACHEPECGPR